MSNQNAVVQSYLFFNGCCEEAVQFYTKAIGAKVEMMMRFKESPDTPPPGTVPEGFGEKIMHVSFRVGQTVLMASDGCEPSGANFKGFSLSLSCETEAEARAAFDALAQGGQVQMPLTKTFWSPCFGMLQDKFGLGWMVTVFQTLSGK